jgi:hypothetical protein
LGIAAVERATLGTQQKVRGNAWRAKDLLDHRLTTRQLHALEASNSALEASNAVVADSNRHMRVTAQATRRLAFWTIALVVVTLLVGLVTLFTDPDVDLRPEINVDVAPTSSSTTVAPTSTTVAPTTATDEAP